MRLSDKTYSSADAKQSFGQMIDDAQHNPIPNAETIQAMQDMEQGINIAKFDSIEALKADLLSD